MSYELELIPDENEILIENIYKSIGEYIAKLIMFEKKLKGNVPQELLDPNCLNLSNTRDKAEIELVANKISNFLGLPNKILVNSYKFSNSSQKKLINKNPNSPYNINIDLSDETSMKKEFILNILAHELTRLYLFNRGIATEDKSILDNELLIDIAAVYLGLGKLILNGHRNKNTENKNSGPVCLNSHYIAFVYKTTCSMRNIPENVFNKNLNSLAKKYIAQTISHNELLPYFHYNFFDDNFTTRNLAKIKDILYSIQLLLSDLEKNLKNDKTRSSEEIEPFLVNAHQKLFMYSQLIMEYAREKDLFTHNLKYLYNMKIYQTLEEMLVCLDNVFYYAKFYLNYLINIDNGENPNSGIDSQKGVRNIDSICITSSSGRSKPNMCTVICRNDGTKLQSAVGKPPFIIKCSKCGYQFVASTDSSLHHGEVEDFVTLYKKELSIENDPLSKTRIKIIEDNGFIEPILGFIFRYLLYHPLMTFGLLNTILAIVITIKSHYLYSLIFFAFGFVFIISDIFKLYTINVNGRRRFRRFR